MAMDTHTSVIRVENISKSFEGEPILTNVSFEVSKGCILGIIGPGGVGKSVLLKIMCGLIRPDTGEVYIEGQSLFKLHGPELSALRRKYGVLFQNYALFDFMNVGANIGFPLSQEGLPAEEIGKRVEQRLREVDLPGSEHLYANELSGGMKKRVSLARATIANPAILLCDDPTAGLDPVTSSKIFILLKELHDKNESTTVVISHDVDRMKTICHRYVMIYKGSVIFDGTLADVATCPHPALEKFFRGWD